MRRPRSLSCLLVLGLGSLLATTCGCGSSSKTAVAPVTESNGERIVRVVAAENVWGNIASQIGGAHVAVTSIISDPNADPHTYETDPKDAAAISTASFVILNGAGYDDFASKLLAASPRSGRVVLDLQKALKVTGGNPNPHLWYDPVYVREAASDIETDLATSDPADEATFVQGLTTFLAAYAPYSAVLAQIRARYAGEKIGYTERVPGYLVQTAGLVLGTPATFAQSVEDGDDPSPEDEAEFSAELKHHKFKVLLYNAQVTDSVTNTIKKQATAAGIPIVGVAETIPANEPNFQHWQIDQAQALLTALAQ